MEVADTLWLLGRDRDAEGRVIPGARIRATYDLCERGLAWRDGVTAEPAFMDLMREERAAGRTIFLSSHNLSEVERLCDRVAIIREGRLVALEHIDALKAKRVRQMSVLFNQPVDPRAFERDGIVVLDRGERRVRLAVRGDINPLIRTLAAYDVADLTFSEPDLEDVFLHYYKEEPAEKVDA